MVCQDANGRSNSYCDERVKPAESKSCDSGPCPLWNYGVWGEVGFTTSTVSISLFLEQIQKFSFPDFSALKPAVGGGRLASWFVRGPMARG